MNKKYDPLITLLSLLESKICIDDVTNEIIVKIPLDNYIIYQKSWEKINNE